MILLGPKALTFFFSDKERFLNSDFDVICKQEDFNYFIDKNKSFIAKI